MTETKRVVVIGGGFAGLWAVRQLKRAPVEITLIDRRNYHLFQPLLYQVATAGLAAPSIAAPLRHILRGQRNVTVHMGEVLGIDTVRAPGVVARSPDSLRLPCSSRAAPRTPTSATTSGSSSRRASRRSTTRFLIRRRVLHRVRAGGSSHHDGRARCVPHIRGDRRRAHGRGAGGHAGRDRAAYARRKDFRHIDTRKARILLIEAGPRVLVDLHRKPG